MKIVKLDHFVLTVANIEASVDFYTKVLGMTKETFGENRVALKYGDQKINLHDSGGRIIPRAGNPTPGAHDLCFVTDTPLDAAMSFVKSFGIEIIEGPVVRTGTCTPLHSFYFRDPDKNLIEVANEIPATR